MKYLLWEMNNYKFYQSAEMCFANPFSSLEIGNISSEEKDTYLRIFHKADTRNAGFLTDEQTKEIFIKSGLSNGILAQIWNSSNFRNYKQIAAEDFCFAMHLIQLARKGLYVEKCLSPVDPKLLLKLQADKKALLDEIGDLKRGIGENTKTQKHLEIQRSMLGKQIQQNENIIKENKILATTLLQKINNCQSFINQLKNIDENFQLKSNLSKQQCIKLMNHLNNYDSNVDDLVSLLAEKKKDLLRLTNEYEALKITQLKKLNRLHLLKKIADDKKNCDHVPIDNSSSTTNSNGDALLEMENKSNNVIDASARKASINELLATEETYLNDLSTVSEVFLDAIKKENLLNEKEIDEVFMNLGDIVSCNKNFLKALKMKVNKSDQKIDELSVGDVIFEHLQQMDPYATYCSLQHRQSSILQDKLTNDSKFKDAHKRLCQHAKVSGLSLSSFLLKPMQRITRYPLLIDKILKSTPISSKDYKLLDMSKNKAIELCNVINEASRKQQNCDHLNIIQQRVQCDVGSEKLNFCSETNCLGPRKYLHSGLLYKVKNNKELMGILFTDFLLITIPSRPLGHASSILCSEIKPNTFFKTYKSPILLNETSICSCADDSLQTSFQVVYKNKIFNFKTLSSIEKDTWVKKIESASKYFIEFEKRKKNKADILKGKKPIGRLLVCIQEGINLMLNLDDENLFCEVKVGVQEQKSRCVIASVNPKWNVSMQFFLFDVEEDMLHIEILARKYFSRNVSLGWTEIAAHDIVQAIKQSKEPITKHLLLHEVDSGEVIIKLDLQLYDNQK